MDVSVSDMSAPRARQLRDEPQSVRYPTRGYQQRQPSLERGVADQTDLKHEQHEQSVLRKERMMRRERSAHLTEDSHINVALQPRRFTLSPSGVGCKRLLGRLLRCESLLGSSECRLFDLNSFSHDSFHPFVDPTLTMESRQKRGTSRQLRGN